MPRNRTTAPKTSKAAAAAAAAARRRRRKGGKVSSPSPRSSSTFSRKRGIDAIADMVATSRAKKKRKATSPTSLANRLDEILTEVDDDGFATVKLSKKELQSLLYSAQRRSGVDRRKRSSSVPPNGSRDGAATEKRATREPGMWVGRKEAYRTTGERKKKKKKKGKKGKKKKKKKKKAASTNARPTASSSSSSSSSASAAAADVKYEVEYIVGKEKRGKETWYLVKWKNYSHEEASWEPELDLKQDGLGDMIKQFEAEAASGGVGAAGAGVPPSTSTGGKKKKKKKKKKKRSTSSSPLSSAAPATDAFWGPPRRTSATAPAAVAASGSSTKQKKMRNTGKGRRRSIAVAPMEELVKEGAEDAVVWTPSRLKTLKSAESNWNEWVTTYARAKGTSPPPLL